MKKKRTKRGSLPLVHPVPVPGDKSISHRALILAGLAEGRSEVAGLNRGEDVAATAACMSALGVPVEWDAEDKSKAVVDGSGWGGLREPDRVLECGNSGTSLRSLLGVCAGIEGLSVLTGDASLRARPMGRVTGPLGEMGARIHGRGGGELAPLAVTGGALRGRSFSLPVASAQVKTALLLAGLRADGTTTVTEPGPSRDHTERMLAAMGAPVSRDGLTASVTGGSPDLAARPWNVPGDISAALFLLVGALLLEDSDLTLDGLGLNPTRTAALDVLASMGGSLDVTTEGEDGGEPFGRVRARASRLRGCGRIRPSCRA